METCYECEYKRLAREAIHDLGRFILGPGLVWLDDPTEAIGEVYRLRTEFRNLHWQEQTDKLPSPV